MVVVVQIDGLAGASLELIHAVAERVEVVRQTAVRSGRGGPDAVGSFQFDGIYLAILPPPQRHQLVAGDDSQVTGRLPLVALDELSTCEREERFLGKVVGFGRVGS